MSVKTSKGEQKIIDLLWRSGIQFQREVSFSDLKSYKHKNLRFDFVLYRNNQILCCIEVDGRQHFEYIPYFHKTKTYFKQQLGRDRIKNKYCLLHNIPLIRVPYWDLNELTLKKLLTTPEYRVNNQYHQDQLIEKINRGEIKCH